MKVSGFTFVRDAVKYGYPVCESIKSILPICDEVIVAVGKSSDSTHDLIKQIDSPKIKIIDTVWDENLREGGRILAQQTDIALSHCQHEWCFYLQADEILHEKYYSLVRESMSKYLHDSRVQGLLFDYIHFYGSYWTVGTGRQWYRKEIRIVRNNIGVKSFRDAQGFRINDKKMSVKHSGAEIYHYGWAKQTEQMTVKQKNLERFWHSDDTIEQKYSNKEFEIFGSLDEIELFTGTHPAVMSEKVGSMNSNIRELVSKKRRKKFFRWVEEDLLGIRIGEYKNYKLI